MASLYTAFSSGCGAIRENTLTVEVYHDEIWLKETIPRIFTITTTATSMIQDLKSKS